ncbi:MAG: 4Fe-4S binding protein [Firmicutes bacterium]|nr:4Fe-4S binding protein [Bacillota bacterium]
MHKELPLAPHLKTPNRPAKTGTWRSVRPVLDTERCNLCLLCWVYCPDGTVKRVGEKLEIDYEYCKGCGICSRECKRNCITMVEEEV